MWCAYHASARELLDDPAASTAGLHTHASCLAGRGWAVLDLEGTSADPFQARIIEVGLVCLDEVGELEGRYSWLVDPGIPFGPSVHGITPADVAGRPGFAAIAPELAGHLTGRVLVAHEASYDTTLLAREFATAGIPWEGPAVCTRENLVGLGLQVRSLVEVCAALGIPHPTPHRALPDAEATAALLGRYLERASVEGQSLLLPHAGCRTP